MRELLEQLEDALDQSRPVAVCRLVETRGSTPQKAGAMMLVFGDGQQAGTLGGGCVEADVRRQALAVINGQGPTVARFQLDDDYGWDDGLICGGRMHVLIDPVADDATRDYYVRLAAQVRSGHGGGEAVVFDAQPSGLEQASCFLFDQRQQLIAARPRSGQEGPVPSRVGEGIQELVERRRPTASHGIACLPLATRCRLIIVGAGHVGQAVAKLASDVDFDVWVVDDRQEYANEERFPVAERLFVGPIDKVLSTIEVTPQTYCLIVTRGHNHDEQALYHLVDRGARYVGMIGSKRKIRLIYDDLLNEGISGETLEKVFAPVGIDIGSQTVAEIAVSITAELVAHRNCGGRVVGRPQSISVHEAP